MSFETLIVETGEGVTLIRLNRPQALNALNSELWRDLTAALDAGFTTLHLLPHVDPFEVKNGARRGLWRNVVRFDPAAK